jgi:hypothetical protein
MRLDFWNNPIVVSAFRVKYRRGGLLTISGLYVLTLAVVGALLQQYYPVYLPTSPIGWQRVYFFGLLGVQFLASGLIAGTTTAASLRAEVTNRTLDFQRIAALSPRQILLGKLLGEPALAYLLAVAVVPLLVFACLNGGGHVAELALVYVSLLSTTFLLGSMGLISKLEPPGGKTKQNPGAGAGLVVMWVVLIPQFLIHGRRLMAYPGLSAPAGLLTPIPAFLGMWDGDIWKYGLPVFGAKVPYVLVTPISQLLLAAVCFEIMARRLVNPLNPPLAKVQAYGLLAVIDLIAGASLFGEDGLTLEGRSAVFGILHLAASLWLVLALTPKRDTLLSWVWRFRGRRDRFTDLWLGDRSENGLMVLTFCAIGCLSLLLLVRLPLLLTGDPNEVAASWGVTFAVMALMSGLILAVGAYTQACEVILPRSGSALLAFLVILTIVVHVLGENYKQEFGYLAPLTPSGVAASWFTQPRDPLSPLPLLVVCAGVAGFAFVWLRRWMRRAEFEVDTKLRGMGALPAQGG